MKIIAVASALMLILAANPSVAAPQQQDTRALRRTCLGERGADQREAIIQACSRLIEQGDEKNGRLAKIHHTRAWNLIVDNRAQEAIPDLEASTRLDPTVAEPFVDLAFALHSTGNPERAKLYIDTAESLRPAWWRSTYQMGLIRLDQGDHEGAIRSLRASVSSGGEAPAQNGLCWALAVANQALDEAQRACDRAIRAEPANASFLDSRALVKLRLGDFAGAEGDYISAYVLDRKQALSLYGRGLARIRLGHTERGQADLTAAIAQDPSVAERFSDWGLTP